MAKITYWNITGEHTKTGTKEEIKKEMERLDNCDILYIVELE